MQQVISIKLNIMKKPTLLILLVLIVLTNNTWSQIISQYIETDSGTTPKGIEIWNNTGSTLDFSTNNLIIKKGTNGAPPSEDYTLSEGTLNSGDVLVIGSADLQTTTENNGSAFYLKAFTFNGDDALEVWYGSTKKDVFGDPGTGDPGTGWDGNGVQTYNQNIALKSGITTGDTDGWTDPSIRFETISTTPSQVGGDAGFGIPPGSSGNQNPNISNITNSPSSPTSSDPVTITADVSDVDGTVSNVECHWGIVSGSLNNTIIMSVTSGDTYETVSNIPSQSDGTTVYYEVYAADNDGGSTTSYEQTYTVSDDFGNIIITEVMQNPSDVGDTDGEWFEIYNTTDSDIDIDRWSISDAGSDSHTIDNSGGLIVPAGGFLVLGNNRLTGTNGGVTLDYEYSGINLTNGDDEIILTSDSGVEVARIEWDGGTNWPDPEGASMIFIGLPADDNNDGSNWTTSFLRENNFTNPVGDETDFGSPGTNGMYQNLISSTSWSGSGNWSEGNAAGASNWSNGSPGAEVNVTIDGNINVDLQSPGIAKCKDLNISINGSASIGVGRAITILGNLSNNGSLTLESDATGNASLIVEATASGNTNVNRYFEAYSGAGDGWHFISSPVNDMTIAGSDFEPGPNDDLYAWDEVNYLWRNYKGSNFPGTTFQNGYGYMVAYSSTVTNTFEGELNYTDISFNNLTKTPDKGDGWHLIGNPFSSAIYWGTDDWNLSNVGAVSKIYDESAGNYIDVSPSGIIPSTNGFFIQVSSATNSFTIPKSARIHNTTNNYKSPEIREIIETLKFIVNNDDNSFYDVTTIAFDENAEVDFEWERDAHKLFGQSVAPQLWTFIDDEMFSTNTLPPFYESLTIDLNFKAGVNSTYHLIPEGLESFNLNSEIYLEDLFTNEIINLKETDIYSFQANTSDNTQRFKLHFYGLMDIEESTALKDINIYSNQNHVLVKMPKQGINYNIQIFDIMGRILLDKDMISSGTDKFFFDRSNSILIVRTVCNNKVNSRKVLLK